MKVNVTVKILRVDQLHTFELNDLSYETQQTLRKMPEGERMTKSLLFIDSFPCRIVDNKAISRYFPMFIPRTLQDAVALIRDCDSLVMQRDAVHVRWTGYEFLTRDGKTWSPKPDDILSNKEEWYVYSETEQGQAETKLPNF